MSKRIVRIVLALLAAIVVVAIFNTSLKASEELADSEIVAAEPEETYIPEVEEPIVAIATEEPVVEVVEIEEADVEEVTPSPEVTISPEPTEEPTPEPTSTPEPEPTPFNPDNTDHTLDVEVWFDYAEPLKLGDTVYVCSTVSGGHDYTYQWFYSVDDVNWIKLPSETGPTTSFILSEENCNWYWLLYVESPD